MLGLLPQHNKFIINTNYQYTHTQSIIKSRQQALPSRELDSRVVNAVIARLKIVGQARYMEWTHRTPLNRKNNRPSSVAIHGMRWELIGPCSKV